jgi:GT2 family glycosyltransferase
VNIHIAILTMGKQKNIETLFSDLFWSSVWGRVASVQVLSQVDAVHYQRPSRAVLPRLHIHNMPHNMGCAGGRKALTDFLMVLGLKREDIIVYLDDDIEVVAHDWLIKLVEPLLSGYSISGVDGRRLTSELLTEVDRDNPDYVSGGWCAIKAEVFLEGCMFDEQFNPNYFEDVDLCFQAKAKGKSIKAVGDIGLRHEHLAGASASQLVKENSLKFGKKWGLL